MTYLIPPNETQLEFIRKETTWQSADKLDEDVTRLIEWLSQQPHLPNITDRLWLSHFIPGCKYNLQRSKEVLESYFVKRAEFPEFFDPITTEQLEKAKKFGSICLFPNLTPEGYRIFCVSSYQCDDDSDYDAMIYAKMAIAVHDVQLKEEPMYGNIFLYDLKHYTLSLFLAFTPTLTKKFLTIWLNTFPLRVKSIHFVNPPKFIDRLLTFTKMFVPPKIKNRFFVHSSIEDLHKYLPRDILPDAFGGTNGTLQEYEEGSYKLFQSYKEWLETRPKADLSRRPARPADTDELDMNGTFKQLQID